MQKLITVIAASLALAFTGLHAQSDEPTLNERITATWDDRKTLDWSAADVDALADDIRAANPAEVDRTLAAAYILLGADRDGSPFKNPVPTDLAPDSETWWRAAVTADGRIDDIINVWIDEDPDSLRNDANPQHVYGWGVDQGNYHFSDLADYIVGKGIKPNKEYKRDFKSYRSTLTPDAQISLTQKEKDGLIAVSTRNERQDKWLNELSADLVALQLDQ